MIACQGMAASAPHVAGAGELWLVKGEEAARTTNRLGPVVVLARRALERLQLGEHRVGLVALLALFAAVRTDRRRSRSLRSGGRGLRCRQQRRADRSRRFGRPGGARGPLDLGVEVDLRAKAERDR